jgi:hypothetical protein
MRHDDSALRAALGVLGLAEDADRDTVIHAYRRLARESHPDLSDAPDAATRFDAVTAAYRHVLDHAPAGTAEAVPQVMPKVMSFPLSPYLPNLSVGRGVGGRLQPAIVVGPAWVEPLPMHPPTTPGSTGGRVDGRVDGRAGSRTRGRTGRGT